MPDLSVSKTNQEKANKLISNFLDATERQVKTTAKDFSGVSSIVRFIKKDKSDPSEKIVLETIRRMQKDKINPQIALQISEATMNKLQNQQKIAIFKMLPFLLGIAGILTMVVLILFAQPFSFDNPLIQKYLLGLAFFLPLLIWGMINRQKVKFDLLSTNILFQASSAYASAKMQGKGEIAALQNLSQMKRMAQKQSVGKKDKKKSKKSS